MRNIPVVFLMLLMLTSCGEKPDVSAPQQAAPSSSAQTAVSDERTETDNTTYAASESPLSDTVFVMDEPYSFSEVDPSLGPGPFSVNELSEIFGEPSWINGYYDDKNNGIGYYVISVMFKDVMFDLVANNGEELNLISAGDGIYTVPDSAMDIPMKTKYTSVSNGDLALPRRIKLGDSIDALYLAYNGNRGDERSAQGELLISYAYGESDSIIYHFNGASTDGVIGELEQVTVEWYNDNEPNYSLQSEKTPCPPA